MIRIFVLAFVALNVLVSCASHVVTGPYQPATKPEKIEFARDHRDIYPDDVRKAPATHTNDPVVWAGVIRSTDAYEENDGDQIVAETIFEHHYFNWIQDGHGHKVKLSVSPDGEGLFRARWHMEKLGLEASAESAEKYAGKGKLAIVYGVPEKVDTNGMVVLAYRYLRIVDADHFSMSKSDYGRTGEQCCSAPAACTTNAPPLKAH